jgi:hypothetical protein
MLTDFKIKSEGEGNYADAKKSRDKYEELQNEEIRRHLDNLKMSQEQELKSIEEEHKSQFNEYCESWDRFMQEYEASSVKTLEMIKVWH